MTISTERTPSRTGADIAAPSGPPSVRRRAPSLLAIGDLLLDVVVVPAMPLEVGSDVPGSVRFRQGGSAANTARAFSRLGGRASLAAAVGDDRWGRQLATSLRADGVRLHLAKVSAATGRLTALIGPNGERSFITERGAADLLRPGRIEAAWCRGLDVLHVPVYSLLAEPLASAAAKGMRLARAAGALLSCDLSSRAPLLAYGAEAMRARLLELGPDILFADRAEAATLLGSGLERRLPRLLDVAPIAVVKEGPAGCRVLWRTGDAGEGLAIEVAASRVAATDTTGAGDVFAAGFLHTLTAGALVRDAVLLRRAALAGHRVAAAHLRARRPELDLR